MKRFFQQFIRMDNVAAPIFAMGVNDPTPAISGNGAAIAPRPVYRLATISDQLQCRFV
jgi:hypothetical protein